MTMPAPTPLRAATVSARRRWVTTGLLATGAALALGACGRKSAPRAQAVPAGATVLALGDSLTSGVGTAPDTAYPALLAQRTGWKVVNGGVSGDTSAQALARLPELLRQHQPRLVIVSLGGNDFLRRQSASDTRQNLRTISDNALASGAQVVLVAVPELTALAALGRLSDHPLYAELAQELKIPLHSQGWSDVLAQPELRSDTVHANAAGYARFAEGLAQMLKGAGLWSG